MDPSFCERAASCFGNKDGDEGRLFSGSSGYYGVVVSIGGTPSYARSPTVQCAGYPSGSQSALPRTCHTHRTRDKPEALQGFVTSKVQLVTGSATI